MKNKFRVQWVEMKYQARKRKENFYFWLARHLPKRIVYHCTIQAMCHATMGPYSDQIVPELYAMDVLKRYGDDHGLHS